MRIYYSEDVFLTSNKNQTNTFTGNEFRDNYNF